MYQKKLKSQTFEITTDCFCGSSGIFVGGGGKVVGPTMPQATDKSATLFNQFPGTSSVSSCKPSQIVEVSYTSQAQLVKQHTGKWCEDHPNKNQSVVDVHPVYLNTGGSKILHDLRIDNIDMFHVLKHTDVHCHATLLLSTYVSS